MGIRDWRKENKGITLISLIVIIIILLILTGIIVMASYNDGVINKADESSDQYDIGKEKEYLKLTFTHFQMNYMEKGLGFTNDEYKEELNKYIDSVEIGDATDEDKEKYGIEIDFQESLGGYMKITFKVTNNSYVVARIKNKNNTEPVGPDIPEKKTYTVTYNANGGENAPIVQTKTEGRSLTLSTQIPNRNGYTFKGWSIIQNSEVTYNPGGTFDRDMNTTLYAVWQINTYTITYDLNGGTLLSQNPGSYTVETDTITLNNPSKEGYMFLGWTGSNGEIPQRTVKIEKGTTENKEYTAVYGEGNYRVNGTYYIDLEEAINACENNVETTIEVLKNCDDLFKNNNIENKNIILNLGNNTLNLSKTINVKSGSSLKIIGEGKIQNQSDVAISVEGTLIIGENNATVGKTPIIEGTTFGISTSSGKLYFYDGQIIGDKAVNGEITKLPESYTALSKTENSKEVVYLDIVADAVARIGYKYFTTLQAAVDAVQSGIDNQVEIIMVDNATVSSAVTINDTKNIKLNLDGHTVQASGNTYVLDNSGKLEIVDTSSAQTGTIDNSAYRAIKNQKELILTNGTISIGAGTSSNYQRGIDNTETGIFTMNGGTIKSDKNYTRMIFNDNGKVYINNGTILASSSWGQGVFNEKNGYVEINNGNITSGHYTICNTSTANSNGTIQINGGDITCTSTNIDNGVSYPKVIYNGSIGTINIAGGTINKNFKAIWQGGDGTINITGGIINGLGDVVNNRSNSGKINITGGVITGNSYLVRNESSKGEVVIENVELISKQSYNSVASGNSSSTTIINNSNVKGIENGNSSNLLIKGKSIITAKDANSNAISNGSGSIIIGEKIDEGVEEKPQTEPLIQGGKYGIYKNDVFGKIYFYDGTIKGTTNAIYGNVNEIEDKAEILINKADGYEVATLTTDIQPVAQIGKNTYKTLNEAINAVEGTEETTITILRDFEIIAPQTSSTIEEGKNIVIDLNGYNMTSTLENTIVNNGNLKITDSNTEKQGAITIDLTGKNTYTSGIVNESTGKIEITGAITITGKGLYSNSINNKGKITATNTKLVSNGAYTNSQTGIRLISNTGILNLNDTTIKHISGRYTYGIYNETGTVSIDGLITQEGGRAIDTYEGEVNITGTVTREGIGTLIYLAQKSSASEGTKLDIENATIVDNQTTSQMMYGDKGKIKIYNSNINAKTSVLGIGTNGVGVDITIEKSKITSSSNTVISQYKGNTEIKDSDIIYNGTYSYGSIQFRSTGNLTITGESNITSTGEKAIDGDSAGTITIGEKIGEGKTEEPQTTPIIKGTKYGIYQNNTNGKLYFYDGTVVGSNSYQAIYGKITDMEAGYDVITKEDTEAKTLTATLDRLPVAQIGENKYYSLYEAVQAVEGTEETTITLLRDFNITTTGQSAQIEEGKNVVIDLNGYNVISTLENTIINKGNLKITDNNTEKQGTMTINLQGKSSNEYSEGIVNESVGKIEVNNNVTIIGKGTLAKTIDNKGIMTTNNAVLNCVGTWRANLRLISNTGTLNLNDSKLIHQYDEYTYEIYNETGTVNINNIITQGSREAIINTYEGEVNVTGTVIRTGAEPLVSLKQKSSTSKGTTLNIINATITGGEVNYLINGEKGNVKISNSNITSKSGVISISNSGVIIEGSTFTCESQIISHNGKEGNLEIKDSNIIYNGTWTYGNSIRFQSTGSLTITGESNITSTGEKAIELTSTGNTSIKGEVNVEGAKYGIYNSSTGTITLGENDGEVDRTYPCITGGEYGIYQSNSNGKFNFYDGQVKGKTGTIYGTITEIASGYEISKTNGDYYTDILVKSGVEVSVAKIGEVTYTSIQDAIAACPEGTQKTITIENNIIATSTITIPQGKDIILDLNGFTIIGENVDNVIENNGTLTILDGLNRGGKIENTSGTAIGGNGTLTVDSSATIVNGN